MRFLLLLSLSLLAFGCSKKGKPCPEDGNCGDGLRCEVVTNTCQSACGKPSDCEKGLNCDEGEGVCFDTSIRKKSEDCKKRSNADLTFSFLNGECKPNCANSKHCEYFGQCSAVNGECIATKDEDCRKTISCKTYGWCSAVDGVCKVAKDKDCVDIQKISNCESKGVNHCSAVDGLCVVTDKYCEAMNSSECLCENPTDCKAVNGTCWGKCEVEEWLKKDPCIKGKWMIGRGTLVNGVCRATKNKDCAKTSGCKDGGECSAVNGECIAMSDKDCRKSDQCKTFGHCSAVNGVCLTMSDKDCAKSSQCRREGFCSYSEGNCFKWE